MGGAAFWLPGTCGERGGARRGCRGPSAHQVGGDNVVQGQLHTCGAPAGRCVRWRPLVDCMPAGAAARWPDSTGATAAPRTEAVAVVEHQHPGAVVLDGGEHRGQRVGLGHVALLDELAVVAVRQVLRGRGGGVSGAQAAREGSPAPGLHSSSAATPPSSTRQGRQRGARALTVEATSTAMPQMRCMAPGTRNVQRQATKATAPPLRMVTYRLGMMKCVAPPPMLPQPAAMALAVQAGKGRRWGERGAGAQQLCAGAACRPGACGHSNPRCTPLRRRHPPVPTILVLNMLVHLQQMEAGRGRGRLSACGRMHACHSARAQSIWRPGSRRPPCAPPLTRTGSPRRCTG